MKGSWAVAFVAILGCAHGGAGDTTASLGMPSGGAVRIDVVGTRDIAPKRVDSTGFRALQVRMTFDNRSGEPWTVRPQEQVAHLGQLGRSLPADASNVPLVVDPGQTRVLELYYPLPRPDFGSDGVRRMTLDWRVRLPSGDVAQRNVLDAQLSDLPRRAM